MPSIRLSTDGDVVALEKSIRTGRVRMITLDEVHGKRAMAVATPGEARKLSEMLRAVAAQLDGEA